MHRVAHHPDQRRSHGREPFLRAERVSSFASLLSGTGWRSNCVPEDFLQAPRASHPTPLLDRARRRRSPVPLSPDASGHDAYVVFANGVWPTPPPGVHTWVMWSLATEVQFYAVLPWLFRDMSRRGLVLIGGGFLLAYAALLGGAFAWLLGEGSWLIHVSIVGRGPVFLCGVAGAWLYVRFGARLRAWRPLAWFGDVALVAAFVGLELMLRLVVRDGFLPWETTPWVAWHIIEGFLWTIVALLALVAPLRLRPLFVNSAMMSLGVLSYSIYLLHFPFLLWAGRFVYSPLVLATGGSALPETYAIAAAAVALSALTYRFIERPFLIRKARVVEAGWRETGVRPAARDAA